MKRTFYQQDSLNHMRVWEISVVKESETLSNIVINAGVEGGKMVETLTPITEGKNIGRANETTPHQQALADAETEIKKKVKKGYVEDRSQAKVKGETATIKLPMKGDKYHPKGVDGALTLEKAKIKGKRIGIQRKLDGHRYRLHVTFDKVDFYSSGGDLVPPFPQIAEPILKSFRKIYNYVNEKYGITEYYLDGEIYNHKLGFYAVASACGTKVNITPEKQALRDQMHFYLFDLCLPVNYELRQSIANKYFVDGDVIKGVETIFIEANDEEIEKYMLQFLAEGYEGLMIRQLDMPYEYKRTRQLLKYKPFEDDEFEIIGFKKSISGDTLGSIEFKTEAGVTFFATPKNEFGTDAVKQEIWNNKSAYLGKICTVSFMGYSPDDNKPRHPQVKGFRKGKSKD